MGVAPLEVVVGSCGPVGVVTVAVVELGGAVVVDPLAPGTHCE